MIEQVTVTTGSRLHFGPLAVRPSSGREFGGIGLMVDSPRCVLTVSRADADDVVAGSESERIARWLLRYREQSPRSETGYRIELHEAIPRHSGFGSGTQTALALARGLAELHGERDVPSVELARLVGRGRRSAVGIHGFDRGGFLVDAGRAEGETLGTLASRLSLPEQWRLVLITPRSGTTMSGQSEQSAFDRLPSMPAATTDRLSSVVLRKLLPAIQSCDVESFNEGLETYGGIVGAYFAPAQGGLFADARGARLAEQGVRGVVQTSWGPTLCVCRANEGSADAFADSLRANEEWSDCTIRVVKGMNSGAAVMEG